MAHSNPFADYFWLAFQESALSMGAHSARRGFGIPFFPERTMGVKTAGWGATRSIGAWSGLVDYQRDMSLKMFEKAGLSGFKATQQAAASKYGIKVASSVGKRYLIGRAAGIGLAAFNLSWQVPLAIAAVKFAYGGIANQVNQHTYANMGGYFPESDGAYTSRQRTMQAITASRLQARSAVGNEAMLMHR